jgi:hypothetical protein
VALERFEVLRSEANSSRRGWPLSKAERILAEQIGAGAVVAREVTDPARRCRVAEEAGRLQPWYADQPYSIDDWVADSPMVVLEPEVAH